MKKKITILAGMLCVVLLAWIVYAHYPQEIPPKEIPESAPAVNQPEVPKENPNQDKPQPKVSSPQESVEQGTPESPQSLSVEKNTWSESKQTDLAEQSMSIKKEAEKAYQVLPGVTVEHNAVHVELSEDKSRTLEIEKNPQNSNQEMQVLIKKKF